MTGPVIPSVEEIRALVRRVVFDVLAGSAPAPAASGPPAVAAPVAPAAAAGPVSEGGARRTIAIGADHGGFKLKERLALRLGEQGYAVEDCGTHSTEAVDYPDIAVRVAELVASGRCACGIAVDGAGIGSAIVANKVPGVRAALCYDVSTALNSREHNHANVLTLGAGLVGENLAWQIVESWLGTPWGGGRHAARVAKIDEIERRYLATPGGLVSQDVEAVIEAISRRVLTALTGEAFAECLLCGGDCASHSAGKVQEVVAAGASRISFRGDGADVPTDLAGFIDHTLLRADAAAADIDRMCDEARRYGFAAVCVNPSWIKRVATNLRGSEVVACSVVGFPLGAHSPVIKAMEARQAIREGAREIDMVINIGALKSGDYQLVERDIAGVTDACREAGAVCKVIIEAAMLSDEEKVVASRIAKRAKADFVKTSTGFGPGGATVYDVALMREAVGPEMGVKAAGGIRTRKEAEELIAAGATRIGASAGIAIVSESGGAG